MTTEAAAPAGATQTSTTPAGLILPAGGELTIDSKVGEGTVDVMRRIKLNSFYLERVATGCRA